MDLLIIPRPDLAGRCVEQLHSSQSQLLKQAQARTVAVPLLMWLASPARAAVISAHTNMWGVTLIDDGFIQPGDEQKFAKLNYHSAVVRLSGPGGFMGPALDIAEMVWKRGYTRLMWRGSGPCGSA
jgi:hypothetical protein